MACAEISVTNAMKKILNLAYYLLPPLALIYVFSLIGFKNILETIFLLDINILSIILAIKLAASGCRIIKYNLVNHQQSLLDNSKLYLTSRVGSELSILGHFSPMLHTRNQNMGIFYSLVLDRYLEVFSTFLIAVVFSFLYMDKHWFFVLSASVLSSILVFMVVIIIVPFNKGQHIKIFKKLNDTRSSIKSKVTKNKPVIVNLLLLSLLASALEFYLVVIAFSGLGEPVEFGIVAIIWAISGIISNLMLLTIGPAEISSIYFFKLLSTASGSAVASSIILGKVITAIALFLIYLINIFLTYLDKQAFLPRT